jgi:hypothetical protein
VITIPGAALVAIQAYALVNLLPRRQAMSEASTQPSIFRRLFERVFPKMPDFFALLTEQCQHVAHTTGLLVEFMETGDARSASDPPGRARSRPDQGPATCTR